MLAWIADKNKRDEAFKKSNKFGFTNFRINEKQINFLENFSLRFLECAIFLALELSPSSLHLLLWLESIQNQHKDSDIDSDIKSIIDDYQWFIDHTQVESQRMLAWIADKNRVFQNLIISFAKNIGSKLSVCS
jgi:hypothetical protein